MSLPSLRCPNCRSPIAARIEQLIDAEQNPGAKARLLSGALNRVRCPTCGWEGQLSTPLVYHDPAHELLLTFVPIEVNMPKPDQERLIGGLINQAISHLPAERRKGYLLQPQAVLTQQGLVERVLHADGVTPEQLDEQRQRIRLLEELLRSPESELEAFVKKNDPGLDDTFFQLASLSLQAAEDPRAARAAASRVEAAARLSSYGKKVLARQAEVQAASDSLSALPEPVTREAVLDLVAAAPNPDRVQALVSMVRPAFDYAFFQMLSERIEKSEPADAQRLSELRDRLLRLTQAFDAAQDARLDQARALLQSLLQAEDLDQTLGEALPAIDDLFLSLLTANLKAAEERGDPATLERLRQIDSRLRQAMRDSLPEGLQLAQAVIEEDDEAAARARIDAAGDQLDEDFLNTLLSMAQRLEQQGEAEAASRLQRLHRHAVGVSMRSKVSRGQPGRK